MLSYLIEPLALVLSCKIRTRCRCSGMSLNNEEQTSNIVPMVKQKSVFITFDKIKFY